LVVAKAVLEGTQQAFRLQVMDSCMISGWATSAAV